MQVISLQLGFLHRDRRYLGALVVSQVLLQQTLQLLLRFVSLLLKLFDLQVQVSIDLSFF